MYIVETGGCKNFLSENIIFANKNHAEMITALAFMDLSLENGQFDLEGAENRMIQIIANKDRNVIIFLKDIVPCDKKITGNITVN